MRAPQAALISLCIFCVIITPCIVAYGKDKVEEDQFLDLDSLDDSKLRDLERELQSLLIQENEIQNEYHGDIPTGGYTPSPGSSAREQEIRTLHEKPSATRHGSGTNVGVAGKKVKVSKSASVGSQFPEVRVVEFPKKESNASTNASASQSSFNGGQSLLYTQAIELAFKQLLELLEDIESYRTARFFVKIGLKCSHDLIYTVVTNDFSKIQKYRLEPMANIASSLLQTARIEIQNFSAAEKISQLYRAVQRRKAELRQKILQGRSIHNQSDGPDPEVAVAMLAVWMTLGFALLLWMRWSSVQDRKRIAQLPDFDSLYPTIGVGLQLEQDDDGLIKVRFLEPGSPSLVSGKIRTGDILHSVDGVLSKGKTIKDMEDYIIGTPGTKVVLAFLKKGASEQSLTVPITSIRSWVKPGMDVKLVVLRRPWIQPGPRPSSMSHLSPPKALRYSQGKSAPALTDRAKSMNFIEQPAQGKSVHKEEKEVSDSDINRLRKVFQRAASARPVDWNSVYSRARGEEEEMREEGDLKEWLANFDKNFCVPGSLCATSMVLSAIRKKPELIMNKQFFRDVNGNLIRIEGKALPSLENFQRAAAKSGITNVDLREHRARLAYEQILQLSSGEEELASLISRIANQNLGIAVYERVIRHVESEENPVIVMQTEDQHYIDIRRNSRDLVVVHFEGIFRLLPADAIESLESASVLHASINLILRDSQANGSFVLLIRRPVNPSQCSQPKRTRTSARVKERAVSLQLGRVHAVTRGGKASEPLVENWLKKHPTSREGEEEGGGERADDALGLHGQSCASDRKGTASKTCSRDSGRRKSSKQAATQHVQTTRSSLQPIEENDGSERCAGPEGSWEDAWEDESCAKETHGHTNEEHGESDEHEEGTAAWM
ncbi:hypothetical protein GUITHDRAFT_100874 [Guillardia theta CCMP2712]|uniref:PDZ domain-containing protein n=1 Tax=Guillardia theta (strain CCMP2712) TaxID=905079 RepID=L1JY64_GUITC|nr:hypothetical protein GUITHDRAFT_100874 [Guillardia theta CCMP2712]EKX53165.1 hypothetical protein GUITHDRAFT_100874 [Guillardia theta CCMP2712]|eukprot:XP_005840145.1 hypothetical protein GUITHDRAFT_100874 [Guillardia theta CCMP2712]